MLKHLIFIMLIVTMCLAQDDDQEMARKKGGIRYKHKYHSLRHSGILYYLAFLAIKVKVVFLIGSMITFALFAGKLFALLRYNNHVKEPEKIYIQSDPHPTYHSAPEYYGSSGPSYDHDHHDTTSYGRDLGDSIFDNINLFKDLIKRLDLTELAFESMEMDDDSCRKRFICEADYKAKNSSILALGMYLTSDAGLNKYRSDVPINKFEDCAVLYKNCTIMPEYLSS